MIASKTARFFAKYAANDPVKFSDMLRRHMVERLSTPPGGIAATRFHKVRYELDMDAHRLMRKYYFRTHEMYLERIFDKHVAPGTTFIDIGANCGYWSAYALSRVGTSGQVHAFEPVPTYFAFLRRIAELNPDFNMNANNIACGAQPGDKDRRRMKEPSAARRVHDVRPPGDAPRQKWHGLAPCRGCVPQRIIPATIKTGL